MRQTLDLENEIYESSICNEAKLELRHVTKNDSGRYFYLLSNLIGDGRLLLSIRMEPPSPVIEVDKVIVTLFCDVEQRYSFLLLKVKWFMDMISSNKLP